MNCVSKRILCGLLCTGCLFVDTGLASAASAAHGGVLSAQCTTCHGSNGISVAASIPNLAGQKYVYLRHQLMAFKHGERKNPLMQGIASGLSKQDIKDLAAYYADLKVKVVNNSKSKNSKSN